MKVQLKGRRCNVFSSDARIRVTATGLDTYPDVSVVCGQVQTDVQDTLAMVNPVVLVEVLSPSTAKYDQGEKLLHYQQIPSLQEVLFVAYDRPGLTVLRRMPDNSWSRHDAGAGESLPLESIQCTLETDAVFEDPLAS